MSESLLSSPSIPTKHVPVPETAGGVNGSVDVIASYAVSAAKWPLSSSCDMQTFAVDDNCNVRHATQSLVRMFLGLQSAGRRRGSIPNWWKKGVGVTYPMG